MYVHDLFCMQVYMAYVDTLNLSYCERSLIIVIIIIIINVNFLYASMTSNDSAELITNLYDIEVGLIRLKHTTTFVTVAYGSI